MAKKVFLLIICIFCLLTIIFPTTKAQVENLEPVSKPFIPLQARLKTAAPANMLISGTLYFRLKNESTLDELLREQQNPTSENYQKWLTPTQFGEKFGVSKDVYQMAISWLENSNIKVTQSWSNRLRLDFQASVSTLQKAFQTQIQLFELDNQIYYANSQTNYLPSNLALEIMDVKLNSFLFTEPSLKRQPQDILPTVIDRGRFAIGPQDLHVAYNFKPLFANGIEGQGQKIGIIARSDFDMSDVNTYRDLFKLPAVNIVKIPAGGEIIDRGGIETLEVLLDTQLSGAAAPKADIQVVIADRDSEIDQSLTYFLNVLPDTKILSISFGACEKFLFPQFVAIFNNLYKQAAAQGQTVFVSSGDRGANDCGDGQSLQVNGLASSPFIVGVGGTSLMVESDANGNVTAYQDEQVWQGSGGGISVMFPRPDFQTLAGITQTGRTVPDVSLLADFSRPGFFVVESGVTRVIGGTSASAPVWAGILALTNQFSKTDGFGNANHRIYQLGKQQETSASPRSLFFNDITVGNNSGGGLDGYQARPGYDLATGWGTPNVDRFARSLASVPDKVDGLFLTFPNGGEVLPQNQAINIRWILSQDLAAKTTNQDLMLSTDEGKTFQTIASNLAANLRSFDFTLTKITATALFRIVVRTNSSSQIIDTSDANINIGTNLRIDFARYSILDNRLEVIGEGLSTKVKLLINGVSINRAAKLTEDLLFFKGKEKKFKLKKGENTLVIEINGIRSATYKFFVS